MWMAILNSFTGQSEGVRLAVMPYLPDETTTSSAAVRVAGYVSCPIEFINTMAVPRSEDYLNGRSRCGITASLTPSD